jgi:hypothetical protein
MSIKPQWKVPMQGLGLDWGFDETVRPQWLLLAPRSSKAMLLDFGQGKIVKSVNPRIADVNDEGMEGQSRFFMIEGKSVGRTIIEVRNEITNALETTLQVEVKKTKKLRVSFLFVEDKRGKRTIHAYDVADTLIDELNGIYANQTNLIFEMGTIDDVKLDVSLLDFVIEGWDSKSKKRTGEATLSPKDVWNKVFANRSDRSADFNVYFVPTDDILTTNETLVYTSWNNCVLEDGRQLPIYTLAHAIGRMLGCPTTSDPNKMNQLMFWDPGIGKDFFSRSDDFIPRDCARIMNP